MATNASTRSVPQNTSEIISESPVSRDKKSIMASMIATDIIPFLNSSEISISFTFYCIFHCPDHLLRQGCHKELPYARFEMTIYFFVIDRSIALFLLAGS